ncbi:hypothetical protein CABS01_06874 [Colletotrichum abscissum]|uniref:uncharacterized protein n=1 Tax=Colletotrichum abscissum TaxID=1671311 RepID=UPI0027D5018F|nr:uncharacterized protein CABS01_06874 [Colletotrichum abscissum]KAK1514895.1 hypothetical protein CABS01_06874 [Colletotrichum abscissum]
MVDGLVGNGLTSSAQRSLVGNTCVHTGRHIQERQQHTREMHSQRRGAGYFIGVYRVSAAICELCPIVSCCGHVARRTERAASTSTPGFQPTSQANTIHMAGMLLTSSSTRPGSPLALFTGCFCQSEGLGCCTSYLGPGLLHVSTLATGLGVARASVANLSQSQISRARLSEGQYNYPTGTERHLVVPIPSGSRPACDGRIESR